MGSINYIFDVPRWTVLREGKNKLNPEDTLVELSIGFCDDELSSGELVKIMSKSVYEKCLINEYHIKKLPYNEQMIKIFNNKNNEVLPINTEQENEKEHL